jgi:hypothetical protein
MWMRAWGVWVVVAAMLGCAVGPAATPVEEPQALARPALGRALEDRPDDEPGERQVHVLYVVAQDGEDRGLDVSGVLARSVEVWDRWFAGQAGGRRVRLDRAGGALDVTFVRVGVSGAEVRAQGVYARDRLRVALREAGYTNADGRKLYLVFYDGQTLDASCGGAPPMPSAEDSFTMIYLRGEFSAPGVPPCASNAFASGDQAPGYMEFATLHEVFHALGAVQGCAPHATARTADPITHHTGDDPEDLMYAGAAPWRPRVLDVGRDDYFDHGVAGCYDVARSPFLEPTPASPELPPSWR